jgi:hypothetical protein
VDPSRQTYGALLLIGPILAVALAAAIFAVSSRGDAAFEFDQRHPRAVTQQELESLVLRARQPTPSGPGAPATRARCVARGSTGQRNPWSCTVGYGSGKTIRYRVIVKDDGSYRGGDGTQQFFIDGCCVSGPTAGRG